MTRWIVTLDDGQDPGEAGDRLRQAGLAVEQVLADLGVVIGTAGPRAAERLRAVPGVADVSAEGEVSIGPPGSGDGW